MKLLSRLIIPTALFSIFSFSQAAITVVDFSGTNLVTAQQNLGAKGTGFDSGAAISPISGYSGPLFYGAVSSTNETNAPLTTWAIFDNLTIGDVTADRIGLANSGTTSGEIRHHYGLVLFKQANFLEHSSLAGGVSLTSETPLSFQTRRTGGTPSRAAFVIETDAGYFLSQPITLSNNQANGYDPVSLANPASATWLAYDPATSLSSIGGASSPDLDNVLAIGLWFENTRESGNSGAMGFYVHDIQFTAIPEPRTYVLIGGVFAMAVVLLRRRFK